MIENSIEEELKKKIHVRKLYSRFDFVLNHILVFMAVFASAFLAICQILEVNDSKLIALVAALPAFVLLLQKTFKWEQRAEWHWDYRRKVIAISREVRDQGLTSDEASWKMIYQARFQVLVYR